MKRFRAMGLGAVFAVTVAACNNSGGDGETAGQAAPTGVTFFGFVQQLVATQPEDADPVAVDGVPIDLPEEADAVAL